MTGPKLLPGNAGNSRPSRRSRRTAQPPTGTVGYVDDDMNVETASGQPVPFTNDRSAKNDALLERALTPEGCRCARRGLVASGKMMRGRRAFPLGRAALYPQPCPRETQTPRARVRPALSRIRTSMFSDRTVRASRSAERPRCAAGKFYLIFSGFLVPRAGLEPACACARRILRRLHPPRTSTNEHEPIAIQALLSFVSIRSSPSARVRYTVH